MPLKLKLEILKKYSTQSDFAFAIKEHESTVSQVIRGRRKLTPKQAQKWCKALHCDPELIKPVIKS